MAYKSNHMYMFFIYRSVGQLAWPLQPVGHLSSARIGWVCSRRELGEAVLHFFSFFSNQQFPGAGFLMVNHRKARGKPNSNLTSRFKAPALITFTPFHWPKQATWPSPELGKYISEWSKWIISVKYSNLLYILTFLQ